MSVTEHYFGIRKSTTKEINDLPIFRLIVRSKIHNIMLELVLIVVLTVLVPGFMAEKDLPCSNETGLLAQKLNFVPTEDPDCTKGIVRGKICCHKSCGRCGGRGCSRRPGGAKSCCGGIIVSSRRKCTRYIAPCVIDKYEPPMYMDYPVQEDYVPIIGYHKIGGPPSNVRTTVERFKDQVRYFTNVVGCNWITMERLAEYVKNNEKLPTKACVMTFDDGISTQYHNTLCTLNKYKAPATFYLATSFIEWRRYYMTWEEVDKLHRIGHDIEAHTLTHAHLSRLNITEQKKEILGSKTYLEKKGYTVKTFAYPYGEYNQDTKTILRNSDYVLIRDTRKDITWKDPRTITISENKFYLLHFFYIRPEKEDGKELWERIKYTGWWQFEASYVIVKGNKRTVRAIRGGRRYLPTNTSYGLVRMSRRNDEYSTQFLTKQEGAFTLYMIASNKTSTPGFTVKVDDVRYNVFPSGNKYPAPAQPYFGFYVNMRRLLPGVHTLNIVNSAWKRLYLDKFRLFSNVRQDFKEPMYYRTCDPESDDYCQCN